MLMSSIKKRDEVSLSQDTIALKGFAQALQLVIVEAVPLLTEVVQEVCSSSDSDSEDEEIEGMIYKQKKHTLNHAHARKVDKKCEIFVRSIIPYDPARPVDESVLTWADEVYDVKVENMLKLISLNHVFTKEMFRGGATRLDVQRMREKPRPQGRKKRTIQKDNSSNVVDESRIISIVSALLKPEIERVDGKVASALASVREVSSSVVSYQGSVVSSVKSMLKAFKEDIVASVRDANCKVCVPTEPTTPPAATTGKGLSSANPPLYEGRSGNVRRELTSSPCMADENHGMSAFSETSKTNEQNEPAGTLSFSLGLTQDQPLPAPVAEDEMGDNGDGDRCEPVVEPMPRRTSKRLGLVPPPLITDYRCETAILNRARESKMVGSNYYEQVVIREKFAKLSKILKNPCVIHIAGLSVTAKDITDIAERNRPLPGRVFDILMRLVRSTCYTHVGCSGATKLEFFDSRFVWMLCRNYDRFRKSKTKATYVFPKGLVDCAVKSCSIGDAATKLYLPLHVEKKHWIGLCVDFTDEEFPISALNPYGRTKLFIEEICRDVYGSDPEWKIVLLRYFNPVGAHPSGDIGEDPRGIPNNLMPFVQQVAVGRRPHLTVYGNDYNTVDGTGVRDYIHVMDLADGHIAALRKLEDCKIGCEVYNLGTGNGTSVLEMVDAFEKASGKKIPLVTAGRRPGDAEIVYASTERAESELNWKAKYGIEEMCRDSWNWTSNNPYGYDSSDA
ncbi:hypothetical protein F2Q70_00003367 [Brassica cretica]|uniref:UDP-glucose 4-epimerase n=1 Tax=Brassica cretica TaxID=69181 RepID=A0A8S9IU99_BRACR|nr:hypothetical protein F2Q70_00003367 [Brassica cretica]